MSIGKENENIRRSHCHIKNTNKPQICINKNKKFVIKNTEVKLPESSK